MRDTHVTLAQCQALVAVVDAGGFTAAGAALAMTQSGVSHALASLEAELGVTLLERDRGGVRLTEVGERVVAQARAVLLHAEQLREEARATAELARGTLRVGAITSVATRLLPRLIGHFERRHAGIRLLLREGTDVEVREWLLGYQVNVGVVALPSDGLATTPLLRDEMLAVVPAGHPLAAASRVRVAQLAAEPFVLSTGGCEPLIRSIFETAGLEPHVRYTIRDMGTLLAFVREGLGVTIAPALALPSAASGLCSLRLDPPVERHIGLGVRPAAVGTPTVTTFIAEARALARRVDLANPPRERNDALDLNIGPCYLPNV